MKKIILSLAIIAVVGGLVGGATWAFFATQAEAGNTFSMGDPDLEIREGDEGSFGDSIEIDPWSGIYPGWEDYYQVQLRNQSDGDIGLDVIPHVNLVEDSEHLREVITMQFEKDGQAVGPQQTLEEWQEVEDQDPIEHLEGGEIGSLWTVKFTFPSKGEDQSDLAGADIEFNVIFEGRTAEAPITEVTNETQGETYGNNLQEAIAGADSGDTILIPSGTYDGFNLTNGLTVRGVDNDVVIETIDLSGEPRPTGIFIQTNDEVTIENLGFNGSKVLDPNIDPDGLPQGILTSGSYDPEVNVSDSEFIDLHMGIYFNPGASGVITNNTFDGMNHTAIGIDSDAGVDITDNHISNPSVGLEIFGLNVTYSNNTFVDVDTEVDDQKS